MKRILLCVAVCTATSRGADSLENPRVEYAGTPFFSDGS